MSAKDDPVVSRFANAVVVVLLFVVTVVAAYQEGYLICKESIWEVLRAPVWAVLVGGTLVVLWMSFSITTKRLLSLIVAVLLIELVNQWVSTKLGLWTYTAEGGTFLFGLCAWILSGLAAYTIASKVVVRLTGENGYRSPDLRAPLLVIAALLLIWVLGPTEVKALPGFGAGADQTAFWLLYAILMLGGGIAAACAGLRVTFGVFISAWIVGFISEASGAASGIWYYSAPSLAAQVAQQLQANKVIQASPPIYLILGCWSLEVLAQFALSALIANERLVETNGQAAPPDHDQDDGTAGEPPAGGAGPKDGVNLGQPGPPAQSPTGIQSPPGQDSGLQAEGEGSKPASLPTDSGDSAKRNPAGEGGQPPATGGKGTLEPPKKSQIDETLCWEEDPRAELTEAERTLRAVMFISAVAYLVVGFLFAIKPGFVVYILEDFSRLWNPPWDYTPWQNKFWVSMTFSMMMCITFLSFYAQYNIRKNKNYVVAVLVAKSASALSALAYFVFHRRYQPYLAIFAVDGVIFCLTFYFYLEANWAFLEKQTAYFRRRLESIHPLGEALVAVYVGDTARQLTEEEENVEKTALLDKVLDATDFDVILEKRWKATNKGKEQFSVVIKPNFMFSHHKKDRSTFTDPVLVQHLVNRILDQGFTNISVVESQTTIENYYKRRSVARMAKYLGYQGEGYRIVDLTAEMECHDYGGALGHHYIGPTWRDADFRISFAKNKTHVFSNYTLTLKNVYGTLPIQNKLKAYHTKREYDWPTIETMKDDQFPVHFGLVDAYLSGDGQFGVITCRNPKKTKTIIGGEKLDAVDRVGAEKMGIDPDDPSMGRFYYLATKELGKHIPIVVGEPPEKIREPYEPWENVSPVFIKFLDLAEEAYHLSDWGFSILSDQDPEEFPFESPYWSSRFFRWLIKPLKRKYYGH